MIKVFSPNMLKTFELCPKKFELKYVKNINMPVDDSIFEAGKNIHALASYYLRNENTEKMERALSDRELALWENLKSTRFFKNKVIATEYPLTIKEGDYFFGGRLDALVCDENNYYILDYKTGRVPNNATYDYQTMIYLLAVSEFYNTDKIAFVYIDVKNKQETVINLTPALKNEYRQKLTDIAKKITSGNYNKTCKKDICPCEYKMICY